MNNYNEIVKMIARETMEELEETVKNGGKSITFDELEDAALLARKKFGEQLIQELLDIQSIEKTDQKKTAPVTKGNSSQKDAIKR